MVVVAWANVHLISLTRTHFIGRFFDHFQLVQFEQCFRPDPGWIVSSLLG
jgi:hypothetical protein